MKQQKQYIKSLFLLYWCSTKNMRKYQLIIWFLLLIWILLNDGSCAFEQSNHDVYRCETIETKYSE